MATRTTSSPGFQCTRVSRGQNPKRVSVWSGALTTAGDVVFYGTLEGYLKAVDPKDGRELWKFKMPPGILGNVFTYEYGGKQYVGKYSGIGGWAGIGIVAGLTENTAGLGAVGSYKELAGYTNLGGTLFAFVLPDNLTPHGQAHQDGHSLNQGRTGGLLESRESRLLFPVRAAGSSGKFGNMTVCCPERRPSRVRRPPASARTPSGSHARAMLGARRATDSSFRAKPSSMQRIGPSDGV